MKRVSCQLAVVLALVSPLSAVAENKTIFCDASMYNPNSQGPVIEKIAPVLVGTSANLLDQAATDRFTLAMFLNKEALRETQGGTFHLDGRNRGFAMNAIVKMQLKDKVLSGSIRDGVTGKQIEFSGEYFSTVFRTENVWLNLTCYDELE